MSSPNLMNIDVNKLFEHHNILEIDQIQKRLQAEIESKREELRVMVGERYRDLLQAADTIFQMKGTSVQVTAEIENISGNCKNLNDMHIFGFKTNTDDPQINKKEQNKELLTFYSTTVQTKFLTMLHELISRHLDNEEFFLATQLYILARHIYTGLQLDSSNDFTIYFPIGKLNWDMIERFSKLIKEMIFEVLEREEISSELTTNCLMSLYILDNMKLNDILMIFIRHRCTAFTNSLHSDEIKKRRVKDRILASLRVLITTIALVNKCFLQSENDNSKGLIFIKLKEFSCEDTPSIISLIELNDPLMLSTVPNIVTKFKSVFETPELNKDAIKNASDLWIEFIEKLINNQLKNVIELISSMKVIQDLKKEAINIEKYSNWSEMCSNFNLPPTFDLYKEKYQPLINERIQDIIRQSWAKAITQTFEKVACILKANATAGQRVQNKQLNEFSNLWIENSTDIPMSLKQALSQDKTINKLSMKTKGFSPEIVEICIEFDSLLQEIFNEMKVLLEETDNKVGNKQFDFLSETSVEHTFELITKIKGLHFEKNYENFVTIARLLIAFIELCPNFKLCITYKPNNDDKQNSEKWNRVCNLLDEESFAMWKKFCSSMFNEFLANGLELIESLSYKTLLSDLVTWEIITIEEKDEQENSVTTTIRIPSQARISLQRFLFELTKMLTQKIPQTLPPKVLGYLNEILIEHLLKYYHNLIISADFLNSNQNMSLQLYFDLRFLQMIFCEHDNRDLIESFQRLTVALKKFIDPFDFELFYSHLCLNIKNFSYRIHQELGILITNSDNIMNFNDKTANNSVDRDPNVLTLSCSSANSTWFPLLPVIIPDNKSLPKQEVEKTVTKSKTKTVTEQKPTVIQQPTTTAQSVKSGAAAFFGAMGQDWFR